MTAVRRTSLAELQPHEHALICKHLMRGRPVGATAARCGVTVPVVRLVASQAEKRREQAAAATLARKERDAAREAARAAAIAERECCPIINVHAELSRARPQAVRRAPTSLPEGCFRVAVDVTLPALRLLHAAAVTRGLTVDEIARRLVQTLADDALVDAVLDDDGGES